MQNLFEILGLPVQFALNLKTLEDAYFMAQRACHPDRFVGKPEADRIAAITRSQLVNDAYETLKDPLRRAEHLLELQGIFALGEDAKASPQVLMEMMELRERVADAGQSGVELATVIEEIKSEASRTQTEIEQAFDAKDYAKATEATVRFHYLGKAMEEAHMLVYRLKAAHA